MIDNAVNVTVARMIEQGKIPILRPIDVEDPRRDGHAVMREVDVVEVGNRPSSPGLSSLFHMHSEENRNEFANLREGLVKAHERCSLLERELFGEGLRASNR